MIYCVREHDLALISYKPDIDRKFIDYNMRGFTDKEAHSIILGEAVGDQDDVSAIAMDGVEDNETGTEVIDLTEEED